MINYVQGIFTRTYIHDNKKFYASFHPEVIVERENYETTGRYLVVLLHPELGLQSVFLNKAEDAQTWLPDDNSKAIIDDELIEWCNHQIIAQIDRNAEPATNEKNFT
jgi:hypothetical protein